MNGPTIFIIIIIINITTTTTPWESFTEIGMTSSL